MDISRIDRSGDNNSEMEDNFNNCTDDKVCVYETIISRGFTSEELYDTDNRQRNIHNYNSIKDEDIDDWTGFSNETSYDIEFQQESIHNYVSIKDRNTYDLTVVISETELITDCTDDKLCLNKTVISGKDVKEEPCAMKDEQGNIESYLSIKDENIDDLAVTAHEMELMTNCMDNKACVYETIISGGYIKEEPCDIENKSGSILNNVNMRDCEECGEQYDLYCLKCPMLIRIFDSNNPDGRNSTVRQTLPKNFIDIRETPSWLAVVALRTIPEGVVFGPFKGLVSTLDDTVLKWKLKDQKLVCTKDPGWLNWMQYIRTADHHSHQNLVPFQYEGGLYYRSVCHINVGDELLVSWDSGSEKSDIEDIGDGYWEPRVCENLDDSYACTFCCVGYKTISHLKAHNSTCIDKRNKADFCRGIVQCDICKIYLDQEEYLEYHMDRCYKSNEECVINSCYRRNRNADGLLPCTLCTYKATTISDLQQHIGIHEPLACTICPYKATTKLALKRHTGVHNNDKPFACTLCPYKTTAKSILKIHTAFHNGDRPFACTHCPHKAATKGNLKKHLALHNDDKPFTCTLCPYKGKRMADLKTHIAIHNDDRPFACTLCPYEAKRKADLKEHNAVHNGDKPFACTLCPYKAKTKSNLKQHIALHKDDRRFACAHCPHKATTKGNLKQHVALHNGDKPFTCTLCPYKGKRKSDLKVHMTSHKDDRPFACNLCPYEAKRKRDLKGHNAVHNGDKPFACTLCPHKATTKSNLKQHNAVHNDDRPFACTLCPYKAKTNIVLKRHLVSHNE